jgi:hypothetical protein
MENVYFYLALPLQRWPRECVWLRLQSEIQYPFDNIDKTQFPDLIKLFFSYSEQTWSLPNKKESSRRREKVNSLCVFEFSASSGSLEVIGYNREYLQDRSEV